MTELPTSSKFAKWKRPLISGVLSTVVAGFTIFIGFWVAPNQITAFMALAFSSPAYFVETATSAFTPYPLTREAFWVFSISLLFWFAAGATITHFIKRNKTAIALWFLLYIMMFLLSFLLFIVKNTWSE